MDGVKFDEKCFQKGQPVKLVVNGKTRLGLVDEVKSHYISLHDWDYM